MIITRAKAEEAAEILGWGKEVVDSVTAVAIGEMYKTAAKKTHPDLGGSAEDFARVDWAKHALLKWLEKTPSVRPTLQTVDCTRCGGTGRIKVQGRNFSTFPRKCDTCNGTGDADYEKDRSGEY